VPEAVSVVIPVRAPAPWFATALASALSDPDAAEVIVVEDGTRELREDELGGARLIRLPPSGRSAARNTGVAAAATPLVAFLDADDRSLPGRLARQRDAIRAAPLTYGRVRVVSEAGGAHGEWNALLGRRFDELARSRGGIDAVLSTNCPIYTSAVLVRRDDFLAAGGYDTALDAFEDLDLYLRLAQRRPLAPTPGEPVTEYLLHAGNTPSSRLYEGALYVAEKHLPDARGRTRRLLLARRVEALWGLGRFREARRAALRALVAEPRLAASASFGRRLAASFLPGRILEARR
jgi:glycosyltransferase involved in cell wall biosynthesis